MAVQQHVLNWLYSVLTSEYQDVNRTYNDVAQALAQYPSLSPRTDVHTFPNGASALLLHLSGTVPAVFRGATYRYPISLWVPHAYPREAPLVYVTPTENMMVRPGQHVDPQGLVYHPYLVGWAEFWDKSTIVDFVNILRDVFAKEPPVISRQAARPQPQQVPPPAAAPTPPPPVPPLPQELASASRASTVSPASAASPIQPPPPPPKGHGQQQPPRQQSVSASPPAPGTPTPPPIPPHPHAAGNRQSGIYDPSQQQRLQPQSPTPPPPVPPHPSSGQQQQPSRYDSAPPLPGQSAEAGPSQVSRPGLPPIPGRPPYQQSPLSQPPMGPNQTQQNYPSYLQQQQSPPPQTAQAYGLSPQTVQAPAYYPQQQQQQQQQQQPSSQQGPPPPPWQPQQMPPPQQQQTIQPRPKAPPPPDLMDEPLTLSIPPTSGAGAAPAPPPIPPNPEKDILLHQLAQTLATMRQHSREQNESSLAGLQAQRTAMLAAAQRLQQDMSDVAGLSALLTSNTEMLHEALLEADQLVESTKQKHQPPAIDELLVGPTVVANQLYDLVAEERALGDAIFMLGRAVERGRIPPAVFAKMTRSLAREWYLKKALVRKIGRGMGLAPA